LIRSSDALIVVPADEFIGAPFLDLPVTTRDVVVSRLGTLVVVAEAVGGVARFTAYSLDAEVVYGPFDVPLDANGNPPRVDVHPTDDAVLLASPSGELTGVYEADISVARPRFTPLTADPHRVAVYAPDGERFFGVEVVDDLARLVTQATEPGAARTALSAPAVAPAPDLAWWTPPEGTLPEAADADRDGLHDRDDLCPARPAAPIPPVVEPILSRGANTVFGGTGGLSVRWQGFEYSYAWSSYGNESPGARLWAYAADGALERQQTIFTPELGLLAIPDARWNGRGYVVTFGGNVTTRLHYLERARADAPESFGVEVQPPEESDLGDTFTVLLDDEIHLYDSSVDFQRVSLDGAPLQFRGAFYERGSGWPASVAGAQLDGARGLLAIMTGNRNSNTSTWFIELGVVDAGAIVGGWTNVGFMGLDAHYPFGVNSAGFHAYRASLAAGDEVVVVGGVSRNLDLRLRLYDRQGQALGGDVRAQSGAYSMDMQWVGERLAVAFVGDTPGGGGRTVFVQLFDEMLRPVTRPLPISSSEVFTHQVRLGTDGRSLGIGWAEWDARLYWAHGDFHCQ
jgi:hypothetical protein